MPFECSPCRTLAKKSLGRKKEDDEAAKNFTYVRSFANLLRELELLAGQHEVCFIYLIFVLTLLIMFELTVINWFQI